MNITVSCGCLLLFTSCHCEHGSDKVSTCSKLDYGTVVPLLRDHLQIQPNLVSKRRWSSKRGFIVYTISASVQGNSGL